MWWLGTLWSEVIMKRNFGSFIIKYWSVKDPGRGDHNVLNVKHVQSGREERGVRCIADVEEWMSRCVSEGLADDTGTGAVAGDHAFVDVE